MKKIFTFLILICLSFTLVSCGQKEFVFEEESGNDFMGATFNIYSSGVLLSPKRQRGGSASGDRFLDRIEQIEKDYNIVINNVSYDQYVTTDFQTKILSMTLNGGGGCDLLYCGNESLYNFYQLGILMPFEEIGVTDHQDIKFGIPSLLMEGTFDGIQYGVINYLGDGIPSISGPITINMEMLRKLGMNDPHEYVEKGEWNWQNFRKVLQQGTVSDGEDDHVGMLCDTLPGGMQGFFAAIIANGGYIIKEIDGIYKCGLCEPNAIEAMDFVSGLVKDGLITLSTGVAWDQWAEGKTWPMHMSSGLMTGNEIEYSIVRFPYGPNGNPDIVAGYSVNRSYYAFSILSSFDTDAVGLILDDLLESLDASLYPEGWKDYAEENVFVSDADCETYMTALESMEYYPIGIFYGANSWTLKKGPVEMMMDDILAGRSAAQSGMESVKDTLQQLVNDTLNK